MNQPESPEERIFAEALPMIDLQARSSYLDRACAGDAALRRRVEALLQAHAAAASFLGSAPAEKPTVHATPLIEQAGTRVGRYKLLEPIGEGGFGVVWMAEQDEPVRRRLALKIIKLGMDTRQVIARFEAERQALALMDHPNIARIYDAGATETGRPYFVMELVRGLPITKYCDEHCLNMQERLELFVQVCQAVHHAHQKGIIHRDLKPSNILVSVHGDRPVPKVIDFGVAKATQQRLTEKTLFTHWHELIGTPAYMSPEQARMSDLDVDTRSDIYSLGVLLYELLTGRTPIAKEEMLAAGYEEICRIIREEEPPKPSTRLSTLAAADKGRIAAQRRATPDKLGRLIRGDLDWIAMKALEKDRMRRYDSATAFALDIDRFLHHEPIAAAAPSLSYRWTKFARRNRPALITAALLALTVIAGAALSTWQAVRATQGWREARHQERLAQAASADLSEQLIRLHLANGVKFLEQGAVQDALLWFAEALSLAPDSTTAARMLRLQIGCSLRFAPQLVHVFAHGASLEHAEFSPDGTRLVTVGADGVGRLWDATNGAPSGALLKHRDVIFRATFSPDGQRVATASFDATARIWDAATGQPTTAPLLHQGKVMALSFSPDGRRLATGSTDGLVRVWESATGQQSLEPLEQGDDVRQAVFSPDGKWILSASYDKTARLWDAASGRPKSPPLHDTGGCYNALFSRDGTRVLTASPDSVARVWDVTSGHPLTPELKHESQVYQCAFSPDGLRVATASVDHTARIWDARTGAPLTPPLRHGDSVLSVTFSPDGRLVATASLDHAVRVWDPAMTVTAVATLNHNDECDWAVFSPDGRRLLTTSYDGTARLWDLTTLTPTRRALEHEREILSLALSPDGNRVATGGRDGSAKVWSLATGQPSFDPLQHAGDVARAAFSPDGQRIVTAGFDQTARVWDAASGLALGPPIPHTREVLDAVFSPDGERIATATVEGHAQVWHVATGQPVFPPIRHNACVQQVSFSPDGRRLVTASRDFTARLWDASNGIPVAPPLHHEHYVRSVAFSPDGRRVVTASEDSTARVWDSASGAAITPPLRHTRQVTCATFSPAGERVLTTSVDGTARIWDATTGQTLTPLLKHQSVVWQAAFSPDGKLVATASSDRTARVWDAVSGQPITPPLRLEQGVEQVAFDRGGRRLLTVAGNRVEIWDLPEDQRPAADLMKLAGFVAGRQIASFGGFAPLRPEEMESGWRSLRARHPDNLPLAPEIIAAWHRRHANRAEQTENWFATAFHLDRLGKTAPEDTALVERSAHMRQRAESVAQAPPNPAATALVPLADRIPPRDPLMPAGLIDLTPHYNAALTDSWHSAPADPHNHLASLPRGRQRLAGIEFDVRGIIQLSHGALSGKGFPARVGGIQVNRKCRRLHLLHADGWNPAEGTPVGAYVLHYADGQQRELPIVYGRDVRSWWFIRMHTPDRLDTTDSVVAWTGSNPTAQAAGVTLRLFKSTWNNPFPDQPIVTLDFVTTQAETAPFLVALTVE